jgi:hypothetical protein
VWKCTKNARSQGLDISQQVSMPRNHVLGACRGLLGIIAFMRAQRVEGVLLHWCQCKSGHPPSCVRMYGDGTKPQFDCQPKQYCPDRGNYFESKSDKDPDCQVCKSGHYFKTGTDVFSLQPHKTVSGPDIPQKTPAPPLPGLKYQACQHCPINTIVNSQYAANTGARCYYSCSDAYAKMLKKETLQDEDMRFKSPKLVPNGGGLEIQDTPSNIFPGSVLDGYELKSFHSVVKLEFAAGVVDWMTTNKYQEYSKFITDNMQDFYQILRLPPPPRICQECEAGKSMFFESCDGNGGLGCVEMKTQIKKLKDEFSSKLPSHRLNDISWVGDFALNDFNKVGVCVSCPAGTYNSNELDNNATDYLGNLVLDNEAASM